MSEPATRQGTFLPLVCERGICNDKPPLRFSQGIVSTSVSASHSPRYGRSCCDAASTSSFSASSSSRDGATALANNEAWINRTAGESLRDGHGQLDPACQDPKTSSTARRRSGKARGLRSSPLPNLRTDP